MSNVIIEHKDGRRYSVSREAHGRLYPDFKIVGEESPADFDLVGIPRPKRLRSSPRPKKDRAAKPKAAAPITTTVSTPAPVDVLDIKA